jgi:hypothetical protein
MALCGVIPCVASAAQVAIPVHIDYLMLRAALKQQIYTAPGGRADLWSGTDSCQFLYATDPRFEYNSGKLGFESNGELSVGIGVSGSCVSPINWSGIMGADLEPYISPDLAIKFRVTDLNLYRPNHEKSLVVGRGFDLIKTNLIPRLETFTFDLKPPIQQLETLVLAGAAPDAIERVKTALASLRPAPEVVPEDVSLRVTLEMTLPEMPSALPSASAAPLSQGEIDAWQSLLDNWDAFAIFAIKQIGGSVADKTVRAQLLDVLLDGRHRLVQALKQPEGGGGPDPIRILFLDEWTRLGEIVHAAAQRGLLGDRALEFLSFISAGDALFALDQAAPALGMRISADDLRRLARVMAPQYAADPLAFSFDEDPELQKMFGVNAPLEMPGLSDLPLSPSPTTNASGAPADVQSSPTITPSWSPRPLSARPSGLWFGVAEADAAESQLRDQLFRVGAALNRVVVDEINTDIYTRSAQSLLTLTAQHEIQDSGLMPDLHTTYRNLVKSTGWQESCWRQFVRREGRVRFLESSTGDIGLMQVNKHVWRGFYRLSRLEWDVVYNTSAGAEILMGLMSAKADYPGKPSTDQLEALARSTYSAYNGGPDAYDRWRTPSEPDRIRQIDSAFWTKYQAMASNQPFDILRCVMLWDAAHGH